MGYIDHSSSCELDFYVIALYSTHQREALYNKSISFAEFVRQWKSKDGEQSVIENVYYMY